MFVSEYFRLNEAQLSKMKSLDVFDALLDVDSNFFINIIRLKDATIPEFKEAYQAINKFFSDIATLLDAADNPSDKDKMYCSALKRFHFHEVNGINLGFSKSGKGSGWGKDTSEKVLSDAYQIVKKGSKQPEIFHLVSLFEENMGPDRLSDMIATIIEPQIKKYTLRVMSELEITPENYPLLRFQSDGLVHNPNKNSAILLLPTEILHELPIARDWDDVDRVVSENDAIRQEISEYVGEEWSRWASSYKKRFLKKNIFMEPDVCSRVIEEYRKQKLSAYDLKNDYNYLAELFLKSIKKTGLLGCVSDYPSSLEATHAIINIFKDWVENNRGWAEIQDAPTKKREKAVQRFMHLGAKYYVENNNLDFSCEADEGRGPVDIKLSRGTDKTIAEIKLSSNGQYLHGYHTQISEYGSAERTANMIYVFVDVGNPVKRKTLIKAHKKDLESGIKCPELVIIDAMPKKAASTYDIDLPDISFEDFPEINFDINLDDNPSFDFESISFQDVNELQGFDDFKIDE